jgi:hypothetical protein
MASESRFLIKNDMQLPLVLNIEPEAVEFELECGEEVTVCDAFESAPVTLSVAESDEGKPILSIWPGDGKVRIVKDGVELLDLV